MARTTPLVEGGRLIDSAPEGRPIAVGSTDWYRWLADAASFAVAGAGGRFTARKERRGPEDGYWRAYRRRAGKLVSVYLGRSAELSSARLQEVAAALGVAPTHAGPTAAALDGGASPGTITLLLADGVGGLGSLAPAPPRETPAGLIAEVIAAAGGHLFTKGPGTLGGAFSTVQDAVSAAISALRLIHVRWPASQTPSFPRIALHTGVLDEHQGAYDGHPIRWGLQILESAHPGQIILSHVACALIDARLMPGAAIHDLGAYLLGDERQPEHLFQLIAADLPAVRRLPQPPARRPHNLPIPATPLVGRERDLADAIAAIQRPEVRLLTLTGPGGVGKTRLGLQIATSLRDTFADGVFLVDLAGVRSPAFVAAAIAQTLGLIDEGSQSSEARISAYIAPKQLLLLLDNFEQVLPAAATLKVMLGAAPGLKLLVTSRASLHLMGEHEFPVAPLELPAVEERPALDALARYSAVAVFIQRARAVRPDFAITTETGPAIVEICRRLDGLPLAIELAATRCRLFAPAMLLQRLERRLHMLTGGASDLPARQRTLRDTIDWSYQLLDTHVQVLLRRLAAFVGGCTIEAAEAVYGHGDAEALAPEIDLLNALELLVDQSLLRLVDGSDGPRFILLETIREYALERLEQSGEAEAVRQRHARYYLRLAGQIEPTLHGPEVRRGLDRLSTEHSNIRAALAWALAHGAGELAARLATSMLIFWDVSPHRREGREWLESALAAPEPLPPDVRARALHAASHLARALYDLRATIQMLTQSREIHRQLGDRHGEMAALTGIGWTMAMLGGDTQQATAMLQEGLAACRALGDLRGAAWALQALGWIELGLALGYGRGIPTPLNGMGWLAAQPSSLAAPRAMHIESLALRRSLGDVYEIGWSLMSLSVIAAAEGEYDLARAYQEERLEIERSLDNHHGICSTFHQLGTIALRKGHLAVARARLEQGLAMARTIGDTNIVGFTLLGLGEVALAEGDPARATTMIEESLRPFNAVGDRQRIARGCALRARAALECHDDATAMRLIAQCIQIARDLDDQALIGAGLANLADGAARRGATAWAAMLWGASTSPTFSQLRIPVEPSGRQQLIADARATLGAPAFAAAWEAGRQMQPDAVLAARGDVPAEPPAPASATPGLTRREREVLGLLAEGLTNAQIADRLVISLATVKTYLSTIYTKIGVPSRTAAMRFLIDHRLS